MSGQLKSALMAVGKPSDIDLEALAVSETEGLLQNFVVERGRIYRHMDMAEELGDLRVAVSLHRDINANLTSVAKLLGEISTHSTTTVNNLTVTEDYLVMRGKLIQALRPYPEALKAIRRVLEAVEAKPVTIDHG